jgi:hypothetical protein
MKYRIEPVDGSGFVILEQRCPQTPEDMHSVKVMGTVLFAGEVIVTTTPAEEKLEKADVHGRVLIGHGPRSHEVIEADIVVEGW